VHATHATSPWYTSATTLSYLLIALAALTLGFMLYAWLTGGPHRRLVYTVEAASLLLTGGLPSRSSGEIKVTIRDQIVADPYLAILAVESRSRKAVRPGDFEQGKPLLFHIGVPIVAASRLSLGKGQDAPGMGAMGDLGHPVQTVRIQPALIRKGRWFRLSLLTDGPPDLTHENPLADITVRRGGGQMPRVPSLLMVIQAGLLVTAGSLVAKSQTWPRVASGAALALAAGIIGGWMARRWRGR